MMVDDRQVDKWNAWLDRIYGDVEGLLTSRHVYNEVQGIISANCKLHTSSSFYEWVAHHYVVPTVVGIRRQVDSRSDSVSMIRLLRDIAAAPQVISRERYGAFFRIAGYSEVLADHQFDELVGAGRTCIDPAAVLEEVECLNELAKPVRHYVNKRVAHLDQSQMKDFPSYAQIDACLDEMERLLKRYLVLLRAESYARIVPTWLYDWKAIFRVPWIEGGGEAIAQREAEDSR